MQLCSASLSMPKPPQMRSAGFHPHPIPCGSPLALFHSPLARHPTCSLGTPTPQLPGPSASLSSSLSPRPCSRQCRAQPSFTTPQHPHGPLPQIPGVPTPRCGKREPLLPVSRCSSLPGTQQPHHPLPCGHPTLSFPGAKGSGGFGAPHTPWPSCSLLELPYSDRQRKWLRSDPSRSRAGALCRAETAPRHARERLPPFLRVKSRWAGSSPPRPLPSLAMEKLS